MSFCDELEAEIIYILDLFVLEKVANSESESKKEVQKTQESKRVLENEPARKEYLHVKAKNSRIQSKINEYNFLQWRQRARNKYKKKAEGTEKSKKVIKKVKISFREENNKYKKIESKWKSEKIKKLILCAVEEKCIDKKYFWDEERKIKVHKFVNSLALNLTLSRQHFFKSAAKKREQKKKNNIHECEKRKLTRNITSKTREK